MTIKIHTPALCWAGAILAVGVAGMLEAIDKASTTTLLIALPVAAWTALSGRSCTLRRGA